MVHFTTAMPSTALDWFATIGTGVMLGVILLGGGRLLLSFIERVHEENARIDRALRDGLRDIDDRRANDWNEDEWWR